MPDARLFCVIPFCLVLATLPCEIGFGIQEANSPDQAADLTDTSFPAWRDRIRAKHSELAWQDLPWMTSFHQGLRQAATENKPLLLWAMNGHPLGCT